ncbi:hypothetical protein CRYUN_Cryun16bG0084700 [Craigia yunnanensis]
MGVNCVFLQSSIAENLPNCLHKHPLIFIQNHNEEVEYDCAGCAKPLSGPIYHCLDCDRHKFSLHKECAELPLEINHPYDRTHPLTFLPNPPTHPGDCCCSLCKIKWEGFVYCCSLCNIELILEDVFAPRTITAANHEHPWTLLSRQMSFICDFCGTARDRTQYVCTTCDLLVHKNCISLPPNIMITRHDHVISHSHSLQSNQFENWECRICHNEVNTRYGSYYCSTSDCNYIAHVNCATDKEIWDGTIILDDKDKDKRSKEAQHDSMNLVTNVIQEISCGEDMVAIEIKHAYHDHNLILTFSGEIKDDNNCDGLAVSEKYTTIKGLHIDCMKRCDFTLDLGCVALPPTAWYKYDRHPLTLTYFDHSNPCQLYCDLCESERHLNHWFYYCAECDNSLHSNCAIGDFPFIKLGSEVETPCHPHPLIYVKNIWNCPRCKICGKLCDGQTLECKESECNLSVHRPCMWSLKHPLAMSSVSGEAQE